MIREGDPVVDDWCNAGGAVGVGDGAAADAVDGDVEVSAMADDGVDCGGVAEAVAASADDAPSTQSSRRADAA